MFVRLSNEDFSALKTYYVPSLTIVTSTLFINIDMQNLGLADVFILVFNKKYA